MISHRPLYQRNRCNSIRFILFLSFNTDGCQRLIANGKKIAANLLVLFCSDTMKSLSTQSVMIRQKCRKTKTDILLMHHKCIEFCIFLLKDIGLKEIEIKKLIKSRFTFILCWLHTCEIYLKQRICWLSSVVVEHTILVIYFFPKARNILDVPTQRHKQCHIL